MKIFWIVLAVLVLGFAAYALVNYLLQRRRQERAQREGVVVYATVLSIEAIGGLAKQLALKKIVLRVQEPGDAVPREVTLRTRIDEKQKIMPGLKLAVAVDPTDPKRIYPAGPDAAKRLVLTGSREERRQLKAQASGVRPRNRVIRQRPSNIPGMREKR